MNELNEQVKQLLARPGGLLSRLRALRTQAGLTGKALGEELGWPEYRVSKLFNGTKIPSLAEAESICDALEASDADRRLIRRLVEEAVQQRSDFRQRQRSGQVIVQQDYNTMVAKASVVRHFEVAYVPGLLQTAEYARRVFDEQVVLHGGLDDVEAAVATRLERQRWLYESGKRFEFLLTEAVLRLVLPSTNAMRGQLDRLQTVIGVGNIRFGIIPFGVPLPITPQGSMQMYDDLAVIESFLGETFYGSEDSARLDRIFGLLWEEAVEGDAARRLIVQAQEALSR